MDRLDSPQGPWALLQPALSSLLTSPPPHAVPLSAAAAAAAAAEVAGGLNGGGLVNGVLESAPNSSAALAAVPAAAATASAGLLPGLQQQHSDLGVPSSPAAAPTAPESEQAAPAAPDASAATKLVQSSHHGRRKQAHPVPTSPEGQPAAAALDAARSSAVPPGAPSASHRAKRAKPLADASNGASSTVQPAQKRIHTRAATARAAAPAAVSAPATAAAASQQEQPQEQQDLEEQGGLPELVATGTAVEAAQPLWVTFHLPLQPQQQANGAAAQPQALRCRFLFQKRLSASDAGKLGRIVMPRQAEAYLPLCDERIGAAVAVVDSTGRPYQWQLKYWLNAGSPKRMYLFEGCRTFQQNCGIQPRQTLAFYRMPDGGLLVDPHPVESHFA